MVRQTIRRRLFPLVPFSNGTCSLITNKNKPLKSPNLRSSLFSSLSLSREKVQ